MPIANLLGLVERLRERIKEHGNALRENEVRTRYALIDPLLRGLGWDTEDPEQVRPEYQSGPGRADYALLVGGKPSMMIEAKKLDSPLQDAALAQGINYCLVEGTPYFVVTDGRRWEVYEPHRPVPLAEKRVEDFDLASSSPTEAALKSLILWRPNVEAGELTVAPFPVIGKEAMSPPTTEQPSHAEGNSSSGVASQWLPLSQLYPKPYDKPPKFLRLPDGSEVAINHWVDLASRSPRGCKPEAH